MSVLRVLGRLTVAGMAVGAMAGGSMLLHQRAAGAVTEVRDDPLPVQVMIAEPADGYAVENRHLGRLEPARRTQVAADVAGLVMRVAVEEGDAIRAGEVVARLDMARLEVQRDELRAQQRRVEADLELARLTEGRQRGLQERGHVADQGLDEARLRTAAIEAERAGLDAAIDRVEVEIAKSVVRAPFDGTVGARLMDPGAVVEAGTPIIDLLDTGRVQARVGVPPEVARRLTMGSQVTLYAGDRAIAAEVAALRPDLATGTRTIGVLLDVTAPAGLVPTGLVLGEAVELRDRRLVPAEGIVLPLGAVVEGERGLWTVLTAVDGPEGATVGREAVEVVHVGAEAVFVRGTLRPGQRVIVDGRHRVVPGQPVAPFTDEAPSVGPTAAFVRAEDPS